VHACNYQFRAITLFHLSATSGSFITPAHVRGMRGPPAAFNGTDESGTEAHVDSLRLNHAADDYAAIHLAGLRDRYLVVRTCKYVIIDY